MKNSKKVLAAAICAAMLTTGVYAEGTDQEPQIQIVNEPTGEFSLMANIDGRFKKLGVIAPGIRANGNIAECWASASIFESGYTIEVTMSVESQKQGSSWWTTENTWSPVSSHDTAGIESQWYMTKGYRYRVLAECDVYTNSGTFVESVSGYSSTVSR